MSESPLPEAAGSADADLPEHVRRIEARAKALGLNMTALCREAKVARSTWTRICNGTHEANMRTLRKFEEKLRALEAAGQEGECAA